MQKLHSLNAMRVIAEFIIVSHHVSDLGAKNLVPHSYGVTVPLMSFFFVLSGFVAMHSTDGFDKTYFVRRMRKTYPFFFLTWVAGLPNAVVNILHDNICLPQVWSNLFLQPLCLSNFTGWGIAGSNMPSWYYTALVFLWLCYSYVDVKRWVQDYPLTWMALLYVTSLLVCVPFFYFDVEVMKILPIFRIFEFFMGCCAAVSFRKDGKVRGEMCFALFCGYLVFVVMTVIYPNIWRRDIKADQCAYWKNDQQFTFQPSGFITASSIAWALIIHWLASAEVRGDSGLLMRTLQLDIFKSMSNFSLQLYLSHQVTSAWLYHSMNAMGIASWFTKEFHMVYVYGTSYALYAHVQPRLDSYFNPVLEQKSAPSP